MKFSLYKLFLVDHHVVTKVIESQLVIGHIGDVASVSRASLLRLHVVQNHAHGKAQEFMNLSHPLGVTLRQIVVDSYDMHAPSLQGVQVCGKSGYQGLTFTGLHLRDTSLVENDAADDLHPVVFHAQNTLRSLADCGESFRKKIVQRLSFRQTFLEFSCLLSQFFIC